jgi:hypothetical protein
MLDCSELQYEEVLIQCRKILDEQYIKRKKSIDELNKFPGETRNFETDPLVIMEIADEILDMGFVNITPQESVLLLFFCFKLPRVINSYAKNIITYDVKYDNDTIKNNMNIFNADIEEYKNKCRCKWICRYTDPLLKWSYYKLDCFYLCAVLKAILTTRLNENNDDFTPSIFCDDNNMIINTNDIII